MCVDFHEVGESEASMKELIAGKSAKWQIEYRFNFRGKGTETKLINTIG